MSSSVSQPFDLIRLSLDEEVVIKCRHGREIRGKLLAYDQHLNMVVSNAKETQTIVTVDPETNSEVKKNVVRNFEALYLRGDAVILISPLVRT